MLESAIQHAAIRAGLHPAAIQLASFSGPQALSFAWARPLSEVTPRPIEPAKRKAS